MDRIQVPTVDDQPLYKKVVEIDVFSSVLSNKKRYIIEIQSFLLSQCIRQLQNANCTINCNLHMV